MCHCNSHLLKYLFGICLCSMLISLSNLSILLQCSKMVNFLFSAYFGDHFCCHSNCKSQSNLRLLHFGYCCCCCFCCFTSQVNSYGHCGTVSSLNHTFSWAGLNKRLTSNCAHTFACNWQQPFLNKLAEGRRMTEEIISWSISTKVWDRAGIELATPGSAVRHASVARHVTDCATRPGTLVIVLIN